ncbi:unnamed protein product [Cladocopium goreaui]|uniref:Uncharacterized protein n=1 Tax=Cladocopium goreaui TaxID=2562237 RepID=A0A9P1DCN7_9DINO|nr:unnamed protein product [Cladocopium goreaui]
MGHVPWKQPKMVVNALKIWWNMVNTPGYVSHTCSRVLRRSCGLFEEMMTEGVKDVPSYGDQLLVTVRDLSLDQKEAEYAAWANPVPADLKDTMKQAKTLEEMRKKGVVPAVGLGPPKEARALGFMETYLVCEAENGQWGHVHFTGPEGYEATAITCAMVALVLLEEKEALSVSACGVLTPAAALHGSSFVERVQAPAVAPEAAHGFAKTGPKLCFEVREGKPSEEEVVAALTMAAKKRQKVNERLEAGLKANECLFELVAKNCGAFHSEPRLARHQKDPRGWFLQVILGTWLVGYAGYAYSGGTFRVQRRAVETEGEKAEKLWTLEVGCTDHYVWKDKDVFVGIVADAGEWTVDLDAVRNGFEEACDKGTAEIFSAPLHVVKAYVKELTSYGLAARAKEATSDVEGGGYQRRDFKASCVHHSSPLQARKNGHLQDLSPELKEGAREDGVLQAEASGKPLQIVLEKSDHPCLSGEKKAMSKFKAYVELATDAAQRWLPPENEVNQCYVKLVEQGKAVLLKSLTAEAAQRALDQLTASGFVAKVEPMPDKAA